MMNELVTVAIASYNNALYIERCLISVLSQSYKNLEIIILDDGSRDNTYDIIKSYVSDPRLKVIVKENGGLSSVRQRALDEAAGEFICFIDADDYLAPSYVEDMLNKAKNDSSDICVCGVIFVNPQGVLLDKYKTVFKTDDSETPLALTSDRLINGFPLKVYLSDSWNKLYRVSFIKESNVRFCQAKGYNGSDSLFNMLLAFHHPKYSTISANNYFHGIYDDSAVHRKGKRLLEGFHSIVDRLFIEAKVINDPALYIYIERKYVEYLRYAMQDLLLEKGYNRKQINDFISCYKSFCETHPELKVKSKDLSTNSSKLFFFLLNYAPVLMLPFFKIRSKFIKNA